VFQADRLTEFFAAQQALVSRLNRLPPSHFFWTLGDGGNEKNHASLATVTIEIADDSPKKTRRETSISWVSAKAWHLNNDWSFAVPVDPKNGNFYHPPGSVEITAKDLNRRLAGRKLEDLPEFSARPNTNLKTYGIGWKPS